MNKSIKVELGERYSKGTGSIKFTVKNIKNPDAGETQAFSLDAYYDSTLLGSTSANTPVSFISLKKAGDLFNIKHFSYDC